MERRSIIPSPAAAGVIVRPNGAAHALACCALMWLAAGCGPSDEKAAAPAEERSPVVAVVGDSAIYADDFRLNYELGFPHLRRGDDPREAYLQRLIDEKLLAMEGYRRNLHDSPDVQRQVQILREELLVEQVFERYVNDSVEVTDAEIREAMEKDRVSFKIRYLPFPTHGAAQAGRARAMQIGFSAAMTEFADASRDVPLRPEDLESPYVTWRDISPTLMHAIEHLPIGEISDPVLYHGSYLLLQVLDMRREPMTPVADPLERSRYEQVVFQRKARGRAREFIGSMMKPLDVRLKPRAYATLRDGLWRWHKDDPPEQNLLRALEGIEADYADSIRSVFDEVLITSKEGEWTVREFLAAFPIERYPLRHQRTADFESDLYDAVGLTLRDRAFVRRAEEEGLGDDPAVRHELALWSDKWVYRAMRAEIAQDGGSLDEVLGELRDRYDVEIRRDVLDTLDLSDPSSAGMTLLKGHTMRPAFPVVDAVR